MVVFRAGSSDPNFSLPGEFTKAAVLPSPKVSIIFLSGKSNTLKLHVRSDVPSFMGLHIATTRTETLELRSFWKKEKC